MTNVVIDFLVNEAAYSGFNVETAVYGELFLDRSTGSIEQSAGAVYGIFVESKTPPRKGMVPIKGYPNFYPVYWGKDIAPVSRLKAHVQNHQSTGNANLRAITEIKGKKLLFGAVFVERYLDFEGHLHKSYPPLKGQNSVGKRGVVVKVKNET